MQKDESMTYGKMRKTHKNIEKRYLNLTFYKFAKAVLTPIYKLAFNPKIEGAENIPDKGAVILAGNHLSMFDPCASIISTKRCVHFLIKKECFDNVFSGWFFKSMCSVPVDRENNTLPAIQDTLELLKRGEIVGLFPEGRRNKLDAEFLPFKRGVAFFSKKTNAPIVPFAVIEKKEGSCRNVKVKFGKPFHTENMTENEILDKIKDEIENLTDGKNKKGKKYVVVYNPYSKNGHGWQESLKLKTILSDCYLEYKNILDITDYEEFFRTNDSDVILCGGDGTVNAFLNRTYDMKYNNKIYYYPCGTGNDFYYDIKRSEELPIEITRYLKQLPLVLVNDKKIRFLDNIGFGLDGYCCEVSDEMRKIPNKKINYSLIAVKGFLYGYKPRKAVINIDGKEYRHDKVWLATTMNGRYYGGGIQVAPHQDRLNPKHEVSLVKFYGLNRLKALFFFPRVFKVKHENILEEMTIIKGKHVNVKFDKPSAIQIDGETIKNVKEYTVITED